MLGFLMILRSFSPSQELIDTNQGLLCALGVSHPSLDRAVSIARKHGVHAKLTGAGGGGCALALLDPDVASSKVRATQFATHDHMAEVASFHFSNLRQSVARLLATNPFLVFLGSREGARGGDGGRRVGVL